MNTKTKIKGIVGDLRSGRYKRIPSISRRRRASRDAYNREAKRVVEEARARAMVCPISERMGLKSRLVEEIHHMRGKTSEALRRDSRGHLLVSRWGHNWIERNRATAYANGWLCPYGLFGTPFKPHDPPYIGSVADLQEKGLL